MCGLGAGAGLKDDQRELAVPLAVDHLRSRDDEIDRLARQLAELAVRLRGAFLQDAERTDHRAAPAETLDSDGKIEMRALVARTHRCSAGTSTSPSASSSIRNLAWAFGSFFI
jgi:hypothetical protein